MQAKLIDLGWQNGWKEIPAVVMLCSESGHDRTTTPVGPSPCPNVHVVRCEQCGYSYRIDSSD
jgi:hypothetical protein